MTIVEAIKLVLTDKELTSEEIYNEIISQNLYQFKAQVPLTVVTQTIRRHCKGLDFPSASPVKYFEIDNSGRKAKYSVLSCNTTKRKKHTDNSNSKQDDRLPEELLMLAYNQHIASVQTQLLDEIIMNDPAFFEKMVLDLLTTMSYGYDRSAGTLTGKSHDGGIDGVIFEDQLGLSKIYVQAKRYNSDNSIGRKELQAFIGAMENTQKGVFITTSYFTKEAEAFCLKQQQKNIVLINGKLLTKLLLKHKVGVTTIETLVLYKVDQDYFQS